jgi:hypothetical protein
VAKADDPLYAITEHQYQRTVTALATACGWTWWHVSDSRRSAGGRVIGDASVAGLPDLLMVHPTRGVVFAELKRQDGKVRDSQRRAFDALAPAALCAALTACKVRVHLWRPGDFDDVVRPLLSAGKGPILYGL